MVLACLFDIWIMQNLSFTDFTKKYIIANFIPRLIIDVNFTLIQLREVC